MWSDFLILDVQAYADDPEKPPLMTIFMRDENAEEKSFRVFANQRRSADESGNKPYYFSSRLETLIVMLNRPETFRNYFAAVQADDQEKAQVLRQAMFEAVRGLAAQLASKDPDKVKQVGDVIRKSIVSRIIRVDWNAEQKYAGPNEKSLLPFFPSDKDGQPTFAGQSVDDAVRNFEPGGLAQTMEATRMALADIPGGLPANFGGQNGQQPQGAQPQPQYPPPGQYQQQPQGDQTQGQPQYPPQGQQMGQQQQPQHPPQQQPQYPPQQQPQYPPQQQPQYPPQGQQMGQMPQQQQQPQGDEPGIFG